MTARSWALALSICVPMAALADEPPAGPLAAFEMAGHRALAKTREDATLAPFTTDGCSGGLSATWRTLAQAVPDYAASFGDKPPWEACCVTHDRAYHDAGPSTDPEASFAARLRADEALMACVQDVGEAEITPEASHADASSIRTRYNLVSIALYQAVRAGGKPCSGLPWRWGYGYPGCVIGPSDFQSTD